MRWFFTKFSFEKRFECFVSVPKVYTYTKASTKTFQLYGGEYNELNFQWTYLLYSLERVDIIRISVSFIVEYNQEIRPRNFDKLKMVIT